MPAPVSIVELQTFIRNTEGVLTETEKDELKVYLALNPTAGVVVPGTGGVRKLRWAASGSRGR